MYRSVVSKLKSLGDEHHGGTGGRITTALTKFAVMVIIFLLAITVRGEWLLLTVCIGRNYIQEWLSINVDTPQGIPTNGSQHQLTPEATEYFKLERYRLQNVHIVVSFAVLSSFAMFYSLAWGLQWYYYINRRDRPGEWKCQPDRFLSPSNERHEIAMGSINMMISTVISGIIATYIMNGGYTTLYYGVGDYGYAYFFLSIPLLFMYDDASAYYFHRMYHMPVLYRWIHKAHHRYGAPTAFSTVAMHPWELLHYQGNLLVFPIFLVPIHAGVFVGVLLYIYYYGMIDHSGIKFDAIWPWQESSMFHDDHHRYFHCNFGANTGLFDWLHDTYRKKDRVYGEGIFGGRGKKKE